MDAEELLKIAKNIQGKSDGRNVWDRFRPAAYVLRDKGYHWPEIAQKFVEAGADVRNIDSFCASMSRAYNERLRKISESRASEDRQQD